MYFCYLTVTTKDTTKKRKSPEVRFLPGKDLSIRYELLEDVLGPHSGMVWYGVVKRPQNVASKKPGFGSQLWLLQLSKSFIQLP